VLRIVLVTLVMLATAATALADTCSPSGQYCNRRGNVTVAGVLIQNVCIEVAKAENCNRSVPIDECVPLQSLAVPAGTSPLGDNQCRLVSETCVASNGGQCNRYEKVYNCWNGPSSVPHVSLTQRQFHNFDETYTDNCGALESDTNCSLETTFDSIGHETRNVNELAVTRSWWEKTRNYDCTDPTYTDTCDEYEDNPVCVKKDEDSCLVYAPDGSCQYEQQIYDCDANSSFEANCEAINVCIGDNCTGVEQEPSNQYPNAAAWLRFMDEMADKNRCEAVEGTDPNAPTQENCTVDPDPGNNGEPRLFAGELLTCDFNVGKNCCASPNESRCTDEERELKARGNAGAVHYMGLGCEYRFLGICLTEQYEYCTYKSKFGRVFQEQAHVQTNAQFAWLTSDPCPALTLDQLRDIDVSQMDLNEVFGDMLDSTDVPLQEQIMNEISTDMGVFSNDVQNQFD